VAVPAEVPVTSPAPDMLTTPAGLLLHDPPAVASLTLVVPPIQIEVAPVTVIADGGADTVTGSITTQAPNE